MPCPSISAPQKPERQTPSFAYRCLTAQLRNLFRRQLRNFPFATDRIKRDLSPELGRELSEYHHLESSLSSGEPINTCVSETRAIGAANGNSEGVLYLCHFLSRQCRPELLKLKRELQDSQTSKWPKRSLGKGAGRLLKAVNVENSLLLYVAVCHLGEVRKVYLSLA